MKAAAAAIALVALLGPAPGQDPAVSPLTIPVTVHNPAGVARRQTVGVALPLPRGRAAVTVAADGDPLCVTVSSADGAVALAPASAQLTWPDGSLALLRAHVSVTVPAQGRARLEVAFDPARPTAPQPAHRAPFAAAPPLWTELVDPWGRVFRADLVPDPAAGPDGVVEDCGAVRVRRFRAPHRAIGDDVDAPGRPLLDLRAYLVTFDGERRAELTLVLDNDAPTAGPLGPVRFTGFRLCTDDPRLRFLPAFAREQGLPPPGRRADGGLDQWLLAPGPAHWLADGTAKAFRLTLFVDGDDVDAAARDAAQWAPVRMVAFAGLSAVRASGAFGAHGGPAPLLPSELGDAGLQVRLWRASARTGPYGDLGDPADPTASGSSRHGDALLHNVLRWQSPALLAIAEGMVLQHALRPTGGRAPRLPDDTAAWRQGLPERALLRPHGFAPIDYEHCAAQLLFEYWWLCGDPFARDELRRLGASIPSMLAAVPFRTSRGEGRCLEAGVLCARATGDGALLQALSRHARDVLLPALAPPHTGTALPQPPHPLVFDGDVAFDAPAQMAALVRGLAALHGETGAAELAAAVTAVADAMAGPAWLDGVGPKTFVAEQSPGRYTLAALPEDRFGSDRTTIGAFVLAARLAGDPTAAARYRSRAEFLLDRDSAVDTGLRDRLRAAANPWLQIAFDRSRSP
ncbi:MAG: hypothetical protein AB7O97_03140 [Planctomycetota bacterium]